jgi:hypothetical protein
LNLNDDYDEFRNHEKFEFVACPSKQQVRDLIEQCEEAKEKELDNKRYRSKYRVVCPNVLLILDDCIDSGVFSFRGEVDTIAERGRHFNLSCIICSQRISSISRSIRINSDFFVIFVPYAARELEQFIEQFVFKQHRKEIMPMLMSIFDEEYEFIMLDNTLRSIDGKIFHSNAKKFTKNKMTQLQLLQQASELPPAKKRPREQEQTLAKKRPRQS